MEASAKRGERLPVSTIMSAPAVSIHARSRLVGRLRLVSKRVGVGRFDALRFIIRERRKLSLPRSL